MTWPRLAWYARRLQGMTAAEVAWRLEDRVRQEAWSFRRFSAPPPRSRPVVALPPSVDPLTASEASRRELLATAAGLLEGRWTYLGIERTDMVDPDWSLDPASGSRFAGDRYAFRINYRGSGPPLVKNVWEPSRHHHITVLACAWLLTGDERYAERAAQHLRSWWQDNPVLRGVNWSSGIELGIRLISWVWTRRLLEGWPGASALFEDDDLAVRQVYWHQRFLAAFRSRGSSANNHVVAEAAGQLVAGYAFDWFAESDRWRTRARRLLEEELGRNTFASGLDREQAFGYHGLVAELGLLAAAEAEVAGEPLSPETTDLLCRMLDVGAAVLDRTGRPPRDGDSDDGRALVLGAPDRQRWSSLLALGAALFGPSSWWPPTDPDLLSVLVAGLVGHLVKTGGRPDGRRSHIADGGLTILRTAPDGDDELWCRCDGGPHGFLSIAAHAHADALSVEVRHDGVELLVDPGTYCYHGDPDWRRYFRSTLAHNTLEVDGEDQSVSGGPFLWIRHARTFLGPVSVDGSGRQHWEAEHDGYLRLAVPVRHRREVTLDPDRHSIEIIDRVATAATHGLRLAFHFGPAVEVELEGNWACLRWDHPRGGSATATMELPAELKWDAYRGSTDPLLGWHSPVFGRREPITTLLGRATRAGAVLRTELLVTAPRPWD